MVIGSMFFSIYFMIFGGQKTNYSIFDNVVSWVIESLKHRDAEKNPYKNTVSPAKISRFSSFLQLNIFFSQKVMFIESKVCQYEVNN